MITIFKVRIMIIYLKNIPKLCTNGSIFLDFYLKQMFSRTDRQTNFKLSHGNTITINNTSMTMKTRPFQQQQKMEIGAHIQK